MSKWRNPRLKMLSKYKHGSFESWGYLIWIVLGMWNTSWDLNFISFWILEASGILWHSSTKLNLTKVALMFCFPLMWPDYYSSIIPKIFQDLNTRQADTYCLCVWIFRKHLRQVWHNWWDGKWLSFVLGNEQGRCRFMDLST